MPSAIFASKLMAPVPTVPTLQVTDLEVEEPTLTRAKPLQFLVETLKSLSSE